LFPIPSPLDYPHPGAALYYIKYETAIGTPDSGGQWQQSSLKWGSKSMGADLHQWVHNHVHAV